MNELNLQKLIDDIQKIKHNYVLELHKIKGREDSIKKDLEEIRILSKLSATTDVLSLIFKYEMEVNRRRNQNVVYELN